MTKTKIFKKSQCHPNWKKISKSKLNIGVGGGEVGGGQFQKISRRGHCMGVFDSSNEASSRTNFNAKKTIELSAMYCCNGCNALLIFWKKNHQNYPLIISTQQSFWLKKIAHWVFKGWFGTKAAMIGDFGHFNVTFGHQDMSIWPHISCTYRAKQYQHILFYKKNQFDQVDLKKTNI